jgi:hypothetical protein
MSRLGRIVAAAAAVAAFAPAAAHAAPRLYRPNPALVEQRVDYVDPVVAPSSPAGAPAPLRQAVIAQAVADRAFLAYRIRDDLGGFLPAPVGELALSSGGRAVVGAASGASQIPRYAQAVGGRIRSFAAVGIGPATAPDNGRQPVTGQGVPPVVPPPTNTNTVPPPNQGFGGRPSQPGPGAATTTTTTTAGGGPTTTTPAPPATTTTSPPTTTTPPRTTPTTTTTPTPPPPTTTTTTTTPTTTTPPPPTTTTTSAAPTSGGSGSSGGGNGGGCGTAGLSISSDHASCRIVATNMAPGGSASELLTIRNETGAPFVLSLRAAGTPDRFWNDLELGVWPDGTAAPDPFPPLVWWTAQANRLTTLAAGASVRYRVELYLPPTAGNEDQLQTAVVDLVWSAQG